MADTPSIFEGTAADYSGIDPDVIRTIVGEGDPAYVASVLANRKAKSGRDYSTLINDHSQFEARTGSAWATNSKLSEDDPAYQKALNIAGPILSGHQKPVTDADAFYSPNVQTDLGRQKPTFDDGTGISGPDGQLYFKNKYAAPLTPSIFDSSSDVGVNPTPGKDPSVISSTTKLPLNDAQALAIHKANALGDISTKQDGTALYKGSDLHFLGPEDSPTDVDPGNYYLDQKGNLGYSGPKKSDITTGALEGAADVGLSVAKLLPGAMNSEAAQRLQAYQNQYNATNRGDTLSDLGRFGGQMAAVAPVLGYAGAIGGAALKSAPALGEFLGGTAGIGGNSLLRGASLAANGALQGAGTEGLTYSTDKNSNLTPQELGTGAVTGAVVNPFVHGIASAAKNVFLPSVEQPVADLANKADKFGIKLQPGQILAGANDTASSVAPTADQLTARMRTIANSFGEDTDTLTKPIMQAAQKRIGGDINTIASRNNIYNTQDLLSNLSTNLLDAKAAGLTAAQMKPLLAQVDNINKGIGTTGLPGDKYSTLIARNSPLDLATKDSDSKVSHFAQNIRETLDNAFDAEATGTDPKTGLTDADAMSQARTQYKNWALAKDVIDPFGKIPIDGSYDNAVNKSYRNRGLYGAGAPGDIADIDTKFLRPLSKGQGSWGNIALNATLGGIAGSSAMGAFASGNPLLAAQIVGGSAAGAAAKHYLGGPILNSITNNSLIRNRLLQGPSALTPNPITNYMLNRFAVPAATVTVPTVAQLLPKTSQSQ